MNRSRTLLVSTSCLVALTWGTIAIAQPERYVPPAELGTAFSIPMPDEGEMDETRYESPELTDTRAAIGSQLIDGRLPRPVLDYGVVSSSAIQRLSFFENGLVVLHMKAGNANLRKRMILPEDALDAYLKLLPHERAEDLSSEEFVTGLTADTSFLRVHKIDDGSSATIEFSNSRVLPAEIQRIRTTLDDLIRVLAEDRGATNPLANYQPRVGDKLISEDMKLFEVTGVRNDGQLVELKGLQEPVVVFMEMPDITNYFHAILGRQPN